MEPAAEKDHIQDDIEFLVWYIDMVENYPNTFVHFLSENAYLKWFNRTIKGPGSILSFLRNFMRGAAHLLNLPKPIANRRIPIKSLRCAKIITEASNSNILPNENGSRTPENPVNNVPSISENIDLYAGGDGPYIEPITDSSLDDSVQSDAEEVVSTRSFQTSGAVEFCDNNFAYGGTPKKMQRPCTLKIGYRGCLKNPMDFSIQSIVYYGNVSCRRNLLSELNECEELQ